MYLILLINIIYQLVLSINKNSFSQLIKKLIKFFPQRPDFFMVFRNLFLS